jgi:ribosome-associated heat shock protein Hsp15
MERVRIDRWLCAARVFRSRTRAHDACAGGLVKLNGSSVKPSDPVAVGDELRVQAPGGLRVLGVLALAETRLAAPRARELYEDRTPAELGVDSRLLKPVRDRGAGRPTKRDRRLLERLRRGGD